MYNKPRKNPNLWKGILGSLLIMIIGANMGEVLIFVGELNVPFALCISAPIIASYVYDVYKHHPKYKEFIKKQEAERVVQNELRRQKEKEENEFLKVNNITPNTSKIKIVDSGEYPKLNFTNEEVYILKNNESLEFLATLYNSNNKKVAIPIKNIMSFKRFGDIHSYTDITGGGGGGSSIGGAIIGGVVAGEAGAIIGSRKKTDEIKTKNIVVDKRVTIVEINDDNNLYYITLESKDYEVLLKLIPSKEITFVQNR